MPLSAVWALSPTNPRVYSHAPRTLLRPLKLDKASHIIIILLLYSDEVQYRLYATGSVTHVAASLKAIIIIIIMQDKKSDVRYSVANNY